MKLCRFLLYSLGLLCFLHSNVPLGWAGTLPIKRPSDYGTNPTAPYWNLLAPTAPIILRTGVKSVTVTRQIVCASYDLANAEYPSDTASSGACEDGDYIFLFQLQSSSPNVVFTVGDLIGFTADESNYGVAICDNNDPITGNTLSLCTTGTESQLPIMAFSYNSSAHEAYFLIHNFPPFPAGVDREGQGLTLYIRTQQTTPVPIGLPTISIH